MHSAGHKPRTVLPTKLLVQSPWSTCEQSAWSSHFFSVVKVVVVAVVVVMVVMAVVGVVAVVTVLRGVAVVSPRHATPVEILL